VSADRVLVPGVEGTAVQLEIENLKAREPFDLDVVQVDLRETMDQRVDIVE
jgi:hypothetical protein